MGNISSAAMSCCDARSSDTLRGTGKLHNEEADSVTYSADGMCGMEAVRLGKAPRNVSFVAAWQPDAEPDANHTSDSSYGPGLMAQYAVTALVGLTGLVEEPSSGPVIECLRGMRSGRNRNRRVHL
jgi:hypothetical protein